MSVDDIFISRQLDALVTDIFTSPEFLSFMESIRLERNNFYELDVLTDDDDVDNVDFVIDYESIFNAAIDELQDGLQDELASFESFPYIKEEEVKEHHPSEEAIEQEPHPPEEKSKEEKSKEKSKEEKSKEEKSKEESKEESKECSICLLDFENNDDVVLLKCKHLFHYSCIVEWAHHKKDCPNCREKF